ncbi:MAG: PfkB family carbohydrate kinase [Erysipelotrichaceae bacterium]|nr:PfkB family carbohydrate kinase [Erysipelotrichaceae bacterium]
MTNKERQVFEIIKANPTIEQGEIAAILGISRSTVAVHISSLQRQGYLLGRAYIINEDKYIVGIGASNIDIYGKSRIAIRTHYDHPADIYSSVGGVIHNIITNYARLGGKCKMFSAVGDDPFGKIILDDYRDSNIDVSEILVSKDNPSGVFMQAQSEDNDMYLALCDQTALREITPEYIRSKERIITHAKLVVIDPTLPIETIEEIISVCKDKTLIYVDPVSDNFAALLSKYVGEFCCVKPNLSELECIAGMFVKNDEDLINACQSLIDKGLEKIYVSLSEDGLFYMDKEKHVKRQLFKVDDMVNASGAGDALMGAILYGETNDLSTEEIMDLGMAAGIATIRHNETIRKDMSLELLEEIIKEKN